MTERTKLYVDMLKGLSLGFFGAVVFREYSLLANVIFFVLGSAFFGTAWVLTGKADRSKSR